MRANLPNPDFFIGKLVPGREITIRERVASGNDGHLFRAWSETLQRELACKVIPRANLQGGADGSDLWKTEVHKADKLQNTAAVRFESIDEWKDPGAGIDCIVLVAELVNGPSLKEFIETRRDEVSVPFVVDWLAAMLDLFHDMELKRVVHGDLHAGNVLVEDRSSYSLSSQRYAFRVTDFGVAEASSEPRFRDDYFQLADTLATLLRAIDSQALGSRDHFVFNTLRHEFVERYLVENDPTRDPIARRPRKLYMRLRELDVDFERTTAAPLSLVTPFDYLSCEQIGEDASLLRALYSDRFLGIEQVEAQNNVVVTGPRGCGKTTVFRSLCLDQRMRVAEASPAEINYIGVYYHCNDLYFAFPRYAVPNREEALDIPMHFVTATLLSNLLTSLDGWSREHFPEAISQAETRASADLWGVLAIAPPNTPGAMTFRELASRLNKERRRATERHRFVHDEKRAVGRCFGPDVLSRATQTLIANLSFLRSRPIYFFIDDYSSPKVTSDLQKNLNRLLMQRTSVCFFKLSTESPVSFEKQDIDGKLYVESREFVMQNLGLVYLHADTRRKLDFVEDVFRRRLQKSATNLSARELQDLVGSRTDLVHNAMAREIAENKPPSHWGKETLCELCSGDIHYVISLVSDMVRLAGGEAEIARLENTPRIAPPLQNRAIREAAGAFLKNLRGVPRCGDKLVAIVEAFGAVAHSHLKFLTSKNDAGRPQKQATRIEPYEPFELSPEAGFLYNELLRYSVFIEDYRGKSRRGSVVPRLYLRRFLIPHFNLTFSRRDSIELESTDFEEFLLNPETFDRRFRLKSGEDAARFEKRDRSDPRQFQMFEDPGKGL
jgi:shikimate kinase/tRNA A-37 threonylcarbamoyl transferase component Bud32